ncbi:unnamed protein product [Lactuca virosa]|uniref:DUF4283 domain-containing protein n=1 Tax=Lactuca virosa TaxID=75947 RepID=A0AAU9MD10_9ASTR|nr:unnamed protein product [Lactuca virosa]
MTLDDMKENVLRRFLVNVSKGKYKRARSKAIEMIEVRFEEHYGRVWDYADRILRVWDNTNEIFRTVRCGKCQELGHNKISCKNDEGPKDPIQKRKIGRPRKDGCGQPYFDQFPPKRTGTGMDGEGTNKNNVQHEDIQPTQNLKENVANETAQSDDEDVQHNQRILVTLKKRIKMKTRRGQKKWDKGGDCEKDLEVKEKITKVEEKVNEVMVKEPEVEENMTEVEDKENDVVDMDPKLKVKGTEVKYMETDIQ